MLFSKAGELGAEQEVSYSKKQAQHRLIIAVRIIIFHPLIV